MYKAANIAFFSHSEVKGTQIFAHDKEFVMFIQHRFYFIPRFFSIGSS